MDKESLEKVYLVAKIVAAVALTAALYQYSATSSYIVRDWKSSLVKVDTRTGATQVLMGSSVEDAEWAKLGSAENE